MTQAQPIGPRPSAGPLPLVLAGAALATAAYLVLDRVLADRQVVDAEPRVVTPRGELADYEKDITRIFEENRSSVVHITTPDVPANRLGTQWLSGGIGSGFVWDQAGHVVTNYHVIRGRRTVLVRLDNQKEYEASVIGARQDVDLAVLKILTPPSDLNPVTVGGSADLVVGQTVLAIGNPFGLSHSLTTGVISALNRTITSVIGTPIRGVIQVDAAINPGNSGGPLLDSASRLIGINTAIKSPTGASAGIGFAVPVDTINQVVPQLIRGEAQQSSDLALGIGVTYLETRDDWAVMITDVKPGSGAEAAGLQGEYRSRQNGRWYAGDVVVSVAGAAVSRIEDIGEAVREKSAGDRVEVVVLRGLPYAQERVVEQVELKPAELFR